MISRRQIIESQQQAEFYDNEMQRRKLTEVASGGHSAGMMVMKEKKRRSNGKQAATATASPNVNHSAMLSRKPLRQINSSASQLEATTTSGNKNCSSGQRVLEDVEYKIRNEISANHSHINRRTFLEHYERREDEIEETCEDDDEDEDEFIGDEEEPLSRRGVIGINGNNPLHEDYRHFDPYSVYGEEDEEEDVWYSEERLYGDHLQEIVDKWLAIDDEIWAKIICMERNRRIAKAYARKRSLTVDGSEDEYLDGTILGLNSFDNPDRDIKTRHIKQYIGQGLRIKITQSGDIVVRRLSKANVFVHQLNPYNNSDHTNRGSHSSSDPYALNSESGDLYGIVGPTNRHQQPINSASNFSLSGSSNSAYPLDGRQAGQSRAILTHQQRALSGRRQQARQDGGEHNPPLAISDHSSSSGGLISSPFNGKGVSESNGANATSEQSHNGLGPVSSSGYAEAGYSTTTLDYNRPVKIFDMNEFKSLLERESQRPNPNRKFLQSQCISIISFVADDHKILNLPSWIMIINIVAVDLLKTELGLFGPHDMFGPMPATDDHRDDHRFGGSHQLTDTMEMMQAQPPATKPAGLRSARTDMHNSNHLAASKKAFANAAALGAYNGEHYGSNSGIIGVQSNAADIRRQEGLQAKASQMGSIVGSDLSGAVGVGIRRRYAHNKAKGGFTANNKANSDGELQIRSRVSADIGANIDLSAANTKISNETPEVQQGSSSSSGFNSHCSSQNDSSAASSNSNIACLITEASKLRSPEPRYSPTSSRAYRSSEIGGRAVGKQQVGDETRADKSSKQAAGKQPRGLRPPKLPHRVSPPSSGLSAPIPIPAPPTEPSGKANLILVSPTGLSPPLPKRKSGSKLANSCIQLNADSAQLELDLTKDLDENGHELTHDESNILDNVVQMKPNRRSGQLKLPEGIPAHAQLAPPATQRHILKYLMSATGKLNVLPNCVRQPVPANRYQRPLPIVPGGQQDESLYYCGLQARVSNRARQQSHQVPNSAINAILAERHNIRPAQQKLQQQPYHISPFSRHQISLTNLQDPQLLHLNPNLMDNSSGGGGIANYPAPGLPLSRPLMKFFKYSNYNEGSFVGANLQRQVNNGRNMFSSVDNLSQLNNCQNKLAPSFLSQMSLALSRNGIKPLKLKSLKSKK